MEIGVCRCRNSVRMIEAAAETWPNDDIVYYGFDVFSDQGNNELWTVENSAKPWSYQRVNECLQKTGVNIQLAKGFTRDTLPEFVASRHEPIDFIWLDGGHTYETCLNDWECAQKLMGPETVVLFDDYAKPIPQDKQWGPMLVIDQIDRSVYNVELLEPWEKAVFFRGPEIRQICVVKVMLK